MFSGPEESAFIWSGVELFISSFSRDGRAIAQAEEGISQTIFVATSLIREVATMSSSV